MRDPATGKKMTKRKISQLQQQGALNPKKVADQEGKGRSAPSNAENNQQNRR
jgi:hypothetical protein